MGDRPFFDSLSMALWWAYYGYLVAAPTTKGPTYAQYQSDDKRNKIDDKDALAPRAWNPEVGGVPRGELALGQSAYIKRLIDAMPSDERSYIKTKFLRDQERVVARKTLRFLVCDYIGAHGPDRRAVGLLMLGYFGVRDITQVSVSEKLELNRRRVSKLNTRMFIMLDLLGYRAETQLYEALRKKGVVL